MELLAKRLCAHVDLRFAERELLLTRSHSARTYAPGAEVRMPEEPSLRPTLIVSGWACRERITASGHRQLLSILLPGDLIWDGGEERPLDLLEVVAVNKLTVINVASEIRTIMQNPARFPGITRGLAMLRLVEEEHLLEHVVRLGAQTAHQRMAGLILELFERCRSIGFVTGGSFVMPLSQEIISNFAGLSLVHVNRVLRRLKAERVIRTQLGVVEIIDRSGLARIAEVATPSPPCFAPVNRQHVDQSAFEMSAA
jgi:CRP-like cAMP-binding protein